MSHLTKDQQIAVVEETERRVSATVLEIVNAQVAQQACPCCTARAIAVALVRLMAFHMAFAGREHDDPEAYVDRFLDVVREVVTAQVEKQQVAKPAPAPVAKVALRVVH